MSVSRRVHAAAVVDRLQKPDFQRVLVTTRRNYPPIVSPRRRRGFWIFRGCLVSLIDGGALLLSSLASAARLLTSCMSCVNGRKRSPLLPPPARGVAASRSQFAESSERSASGTWDVQGDTSRALQWRRARNALFAVTFFFLARLLHLYSFFCA